MDAFLSFHAPGFWLVIALLAGVVVLGVRPYLPAQAQTVTMLGYWVLIPYLAIIAGGVSPRLMGIAYIDWAVSLRFGIGLMLVVLALAVLARASSLPGANRPLSQGDSHLTLHHWLSMLVAVGLCGAEEFFWSFLRGAVEESLSILQLPLDVPGYWAVWIAALLAAPVALINQSTAQDRLVKATILVMTSILFFYTRNFWLCWTLHAAAWLLLTKPAPATALYPGRLPTGKSR